MCTPVLLHSDVQLIIIVRSWALAKPCDFAVAQSQSFIMVR
ncbi:hypothetical protein BIFBIF_01790 [Bifidobacterium bifidum ATCC 29521 = JCM 1255 = DSM 20456]|nr:hypothetical protein BIFBIF_01790 [Bifidobacterium bifidum ATCC 29521 = JCM 1255 = DSM 20456]